MTLRQKKREARAAHTDPINFKCGGCGKIQEFNSEDPLVCDDCGYGGTSNGEPTGD